ncbi:hypothetical protein LTR86_001385 [Recurvomyces mirabilis]|nr:hypothetical protein LTR86_001385 [Recurvomyces mirabilis]
MASHARQTAAALIDMLDTKGQGDYIGEPISQLAHSLQAAHLATTNNADDETVLAALLHDIGQFLPAQEIQSIAHEVRSMSSEDDTTAGGVGRVGHERIGEEYLLKLGFSQKVGSLHFVGGQQEVPHLPRRTNAWRRAGAMGCKSLVFRHGQAPQMG